MIIALYSLAAAMIVGGLASIVVGWDMVLIERGWTMVIAGSVAASSGALLLGVAAVASRLALLQQRLDAIAAAPALAGEPSASIASRRLADDTREAAERDSADLQPVLPFIDEPAAPSTPEPMAPTARAFELDRTPEPIAEAPEQAEWQETDRPIVEDRLEPEEEQRIPDFLLKRSREATPAASMSVYEREIREEIIDIDVAVIPTEDLPGDDLRDEPQPVAPAEPEPAPSDDEARQEAEPEGPPTVVGTYNSGDNHYIMYSDGSIEAETPQGNYRFASLDELKEFIASGGEGGSRAI
jgi:hypothetical protein